MAPPPEHEVAPAASAADPAASAAAEEALAQADASAFPRFAQFLQATQCYRELSGSRFRAASFNDLPTDEQAAACLAAHAVKEASGVEAPPPRGAAGVRFEARLRAAPVVHEFAERLRAGEEGLCEELERASRIVMAECVRNAVVTTCRRLDLWPPEPPLVGIDATDCAYEDLSAPLDVIAQRVYNDQVRRSSCDASDVTGTLSRRALTASYLVDFAHEVGAPLPPMPETFSTMLEDLEQRSAEWELRGDASTPSSASTAPLPERKGSLSRAAAFLGGLTLLGAADRLRSPEVQHLFALGDAAAGEDSERGGVAQEWEATAELVFDSMAASDLAVLESGHFPPGCRLYLELELGGRCRRTGIGRPGEEGGQGGASFGGESLSFSYGEESEVAVRLRRREGLKALLQGDPLVGEVTFPLGPELDDGNPRKLALPLSLGCEHAGTVALRIFLRRGVRLPRSPSVQYASSSEVAGSGRTTNRLSAIAAASAGVGESAGALVVAVGDAVGGAVEAAASMPARAISASAISASAISASLRTRPGFGTCERQAASAIIVTEEGVGMCYYYPYATRAQADAYFHARSWRLTSRVMFRSCYGNIVEELCQGGLPFAHATIRKAAWAELAAPEDSEPAFS